MNPDVDRICQQFESAARSWKSDVKITPKSKAFRVEIGRMLSVDKRDPERILELIAWLFSEYEPRNDFDWRPNVLSGKKLRKHFDRLDVEAGSLRIVHQVNGAEGAWSEIIAWRSRYFTPGIRASVSIKDSVSARAYGTLVHVSGNAIGGWLNAKDEFSERQNRKAFLEAYRTNP